MNWILKLTSSVKDKFEAWNQKGWALYPTKTNTQGTTDRKILFQKTSWFSLTGLIFDHKGAEDFNTLIWVIPSKLERKELCK